MDERSQRERATQLEARSETAPELRPIPALERPEPSLLTYYCFASLVAGPFFFVRLAVLFFRFRSLRYRFDDEGVSMSWGILFRREIHLTYSRIQDIHLVSNVVERWLGLGRIKIQTASASAKAEMTIEGFREFRELRDFLYSRMRGARDPARHETQLTTPDAPTDELTGEGTDELTDELTATLYAVAEEIGKLRQELAEQRASTGHTADV